MGKLIDLTGQRFGTLVVLGRAEKADSSNHTYWLCICDCGNKKIVSGQNMKCGHTTSCGKGHSSKHGEYNTRLYKIWGKMKARCLKPNNPRYKDWGGRGIKVCEEWQTYEPFRDWALSNGYSNDLSIDRIDNDGNYTPDNCRWATAKQQSNNQSTNLYYEINGERHTLHEWSEILGFGYSAVYARIQLGVDPVDAMTHKGRMKIKEYLKNKT